uniref:Uncharacterized protein n=1 Tax=Otus sunia TaxID=257818 RepID=A0A8C8AVS2_9STRI
MLRAGAMAELEGPEFGKADFVLLDEVTMEQFLENLRLRYGAGGDGRGGHPCGAGGGQQPPPSPGGDAEASGRCPVGGN